MPQTVWKLTLPIGEESSPVDVPGSYRLVRVEHAPGGLGYEVLAWIVFSESAVVRMRTTRFHVSGTGHPVPDRYVYLGGTAPHPVHGAVWHLWEAPGAPGA